MKTTKSNKQCECFTCTRRRIAGLKNAVAKAVAMKEATCEALTTAERLLLALRTKLREEKDSLLFASKHGRKCTKTPRADAVPSPIHCSTVHPITHADRFHMNTLNCYTQFDEYQDPDGHEGLYLFTLIYEDARWD